MRGLIEISLERERLDGYEGLEDEDLGVQRKEF